MDEIRIVTRRLMIGGGLLAVAGLAASARGQSGPAVATSEQALGPFYPVTRPLDQDADLTRVQGAPGIARGRVINVVGRVLDREGRPIPGARLDLWQCNSVGRYDHPGDMVDVDQRPLDPNFQGSATIVADASGAYRFRTIKPAAYPIPGDMRTPHIHFEVTGRRERLTTQMYFPGETLNETDLLLREARSRESVISRAIAPLADDAETLAFAWDVVLGLG